MKNNQLLMFSLILISIVFIAGCTTTQTNTQQEVTTAQAEPKISKKSPSDLILTESDLPEGYTVFDSRPRLKSDVGEKGLDNGWQEGYYVQYVRFGDNLVDLTRIDQFISVYPPENVFLVIEGEYLRDWGNAIVEELPNPGIGDSSRAWIITESDGEFEILNRHYEIEFVKLNIYESILISGTSTDYMLLEEIAKKAEAKIK